MSLRLPRIAHGYCGSSFTWLLAVAACLATPLVGQSQEAEYDAAVADLLRAGWDQKLSAEDVSQLAIRASALSPRDSRAAVAAALVELKQRRFDSGQAWFDRAISIKAGDLAAWKGRIWSAAIQRKFDVAYQHGASLVKILPEASLPADKEADLAATLSLLGGVAAFNAGADASARADASAAAESAARAIAEIRGKLKGPRLEAFQLGQKSVDELRVQLASEAERIKETDAADAAKKREIESEFRTKERARIATEMEGLKAAADSAKATAEKEVNEIDSQLKPLQSKYNELMSRARPIIQRINQLERSIATAEAKAASSKDGQKGGFEREADRYRNELDRERRNLQPIQSEGKQVEAEGNRLQTRKGQTLGAYQQIMAGLNAKNRDFQRTLSLFEKAESAEANEGVSGRLRAMQLKMGAFSNYVPYPLEAEREKILASFAAPK